MRRLALLALVAAIAGAAGASALAPSPYSLGASVVPTSAGTPRQPVPVGVSAVATAAVQGGRRPPTIVRYKLALAGIRANVGSFAACPAQRIQQAGTDDGCPGGSRVGSGGADILSGSSGDRRDRAITCHLDVVVYGAGAGQLTVVFSGDPSATPPCYRRAFFAVPAFVTTRRPGTTISLSLPSALVHPVAGLDDAFVALALRLPVKLARIAGRRTGLLESVGGCHASGRRRLTMTFVQERGGLANAAAAVPCTASARAARAMRPARRPRR